MDLFSISGLPVGAITAFGGDLAGAEQVAALQQQGWLICDGRAYSRQEYPELYAAIGTANGGNGEIFNIPDLRGRFLRGTAGESLADPDAAYRFPAAPGGASGNRTGSLQPSATALPANPWEVDAKGDHDHHEFFSTLSVPDTTEHELMEAVAATAGAHFHILTGLDSFTSPINMALYFIIKAKEARMVKGSTPAGAIIAFGGEARRQPAQWLPCNGAAYLVTEYPYLSNTIMRNFGGDDHTLIHVPDLRGYFLRGTSHGTERDPDADSRHASNAGGNTGDRTGSAQEFATGSPAGITTTMAGAHYHYTQSAHDGPGMYVGSNGQHYVNNRPGDHLHTFNGGDNETRPTNIYANFFISNDLIYNSAPPVGTIMPFGGDTTSTDIQIELQAAGWLVCDGSYISRTQFAGLHKIIGDIFGCSPSKFALPDLRGYFVTGAGHIPPGSLQTFSTTGIPLTLVVTSTEGAHAHVSPGNISMHDGDTGIEIPHYITAVDGNHFHTVSGGDAESRPVNVNVDFIIRFK